MFLQDFFSHYFRFLTCIFNLQRLLAIEALSKGVPNDNSLILNINQEISIYHMTSQNPLTSRIKSFLRFCFPNEKKRQFVKCQCWQNGCRWWGSTVTQVYISPVIAILGYVYMCWFVLITSRAVSINIRCWFVC